MGKSLVHMRSSQWSLRRNFLKSSPNRPPSTETEKPKEKEDLIDKRMSRWKSLRKSLKSISGHVFSSKTKKEKEKESFIYKGANKWKRRYKFFKADPSHLSPSDTKKKKGKESFIYKVANKWKRRYKFLTTDHNPLSPSSIRIVSQLSVKLKANFSPMSSFHQYRRKPREEGWARDGTKYEKVSYTSRISLWREKTPKKSSSFSPSRLFTTKVDWHKIKDNPKVLFANQSNKLRKDIKRSKFTVTKAMLIERLGLPRPCTQKQIMGISAKEFMEALGAIFKDYQNGRWANWSHEQAWSEGGDQSGNNLDAMTAAANLDTLFSVERPLQEFLMDGTVFSFLVENEIHFKEGLPFQSVYKLDWGVAGFATFIIDCKSHSRSGLGETEASKALIESEFILSKR